MHPKGYDHPDLLWSAEELHTRLGDPRLVLIDVREASTFARGWIPGAVHFDLFGISLNDTSPQPLAAFMWMMQHLFELRGVNLDKTVVFYEGIAGMRAARGFWLLEYLGHDDVHVLDGGFKAWQAAGYPITTEPTQVQAVSFAPRPQAHSHISADELHGLLGSGDLAVLDTRTDGEYTGSTVRAARGWTHNLDANGAFKPAAELRAMYNAAGVHPGQTVVAF
jgi:thiosulfate/3-mercaptopyruvate sulfurtransferase